jgi:hypothetical protein
MRVRESQVLIEQVLGRVMICNKIEFNVEVVFFANVEVQIELLCVVLAIKIDALILVTSDGFVEIRGC